MITPELVKEQNSKKFLAKCAICDGTSVKIVRLGHAFAVVCKYCLDTFSRKELELMHNMFLAFGGFFGKNTNSKEETYQELKKIAAEYAQSGKDITKIENDVKNLHRAFIHGITPMQLVQGLRVLSD